MASAYANIASELERLRDARPCGASNRAEPDARQDRGPIGPRARNTQMADRNHTTARRSSHSSRGGDKANATRTPVEEREWFHHDLGVGGFGNHQGSVALDDAAGSGDGQSRSFSAAVASLYHSKIAKGFAVIAAVLIIII